MRYVFLFLSALMLACSGDDGGNDKKLVFTFYDSETGLDAIGSTHIEPKSGQVVAIHISDGAREVVADRSKNNLYMSMGQNAEILVYKDYDLADPKILYDTDYGIGPIAIDVENKKIYWVSTNWGKVYMGSLDGKAAAVPLFGGDELTNLCTGLAVDPSQNKLYLLDAESKRILAADLTAGTDPVELMTSEDFTMDQPHDLAVSEDGTTLYWIDTNKIVQTNTGTGASTIFRNSAARHLYLHYPTNHMYVSFSNKVSKTEIGGETTFQSVFQEDAGDVMYLIVD